MPDSPIRRVSRIVKDWLYVADTGNHALRRIRVLSGEVETAAGTGTIGYELPNDDVEPTRVAMSAPTAVTGAGEKVYFTLAGQNQVWQLDLIKNRLSVLAGSGQLGMTDGDGLTASFAQPSGISLIGQQLVICDSASSSLRMLRLLDNNVSTLIGAGLYEFGDVQGKRDVARLQHPLDVCADPRGLIFVADSYNGKIKALNMRTGEVRALNLPYNLSEPNGVSLANNALWIANTNAHEIVRVDLKTGQIRRLTIGELMHACPSRSIQPTRFRRQGIRPHADDLARRLPHARRARRTALRRQGRQPQEARRQLFPQAAHGTAHRGDGRRRSRTSKTTLTRTEAEALLLEAQLIKSAEAALQHPAARRQEFSVHLPVAGRRLSAHGVPSRRASRARAIFRTVPERGRGARTAST